MRRPRLSCIGASRGWLARRILALFACIVIHIGALNRNPGSHVAVQQAYRGGGDVGVGANAYNRRRRHHGRGHSHHREISGGIHSDVPSYTAEGLTGNNTEGVDPPVDVGGGTEYPDAIEITGADLIGSSVRLDGIYLREWDVNGAPHFKRRSKVS